MTISHLGATQYPCNRWTVPAIEFLQYKSCSRCSSHLRNDRFSEVFQELGAEKKIHIFYYLPVGNWAACPRQRCDTSEVLEKSLILKYFWDLVSRLLEISCQVFQNRANRSFRIQDLARAVQGSQTDISGSFCSAHTRVWRGKMKPECLFMESALFNLPQVPRLGLKWSCFLPSLPQDFCFFQFSCLVMSDSLWPHGM